MPVDSLVDTCKRHYLIIFSLLFLSWFRLSSNTPVLFLADSLKYILLDEVILGRWLSTIWVSINFSLFERIVNYFIQISNGNDLSPTIFLNKAVAILSTLLVYLIIYRACSKIMPALVGALVFSLNPAMLYIEQTVMPEAFFLFFILLVTILIQEVLAVSGSKIIWVSAIAGLIGGIAESTKQTASNWIFSVSLGLLIIGIYRFLSKKEKLLVFCSVVFYVMSFVPRIPVYYYSYKSFGSFDFSLSRTVDSARGVLLWSLTEEMVYANKSNSYPWLTQMIIVTTEDIKRQIAINDTNSNTQAFYIAISRINVAGREGRLQHPYTGMLISIPEWSRICSRYWFEQSFSQPALLLKRIWQISCANLFLKEDLGLFVFENSLRPMVNFQPIQYTKVPFSFRSQLDPQLMNTRAEKISIQSNEVSKVRDFYSYFKLNSDSNHYLVMVNMNLPYAFRLPINGLSVQWQRLWTWFPWIYVIGPLFLLSLTSYLIKKDFKLFDLFILGSVLYFTLLPLLFSLAEARYRLQFLPFMIIFIAINFARICNKGNNK